MSAQAGDTWRAEQPPLWLRVMPVLCWLACSLALECSPDAALPAFQDAGLALPLSMELRLQTWLVRLGEVLPMRRDHRMGTEDSGQRSGRLSVVAIRQTEDPVQEGPMPATENVQHACLTSFFGCVLLKKVSWKL
jgi:hypothetical protein